MVNLALKILIKHSNVTKTMQFDPACIVYDACRIIREKTPEAQQGQAQDYSLFLSDKDPKKGVWLESRRPLEYYLLRDGDVLEYKLKHRPLKVRTLDASIKTVMIDDSNTVEQLMITICTRLGIVNHEEYSLVRDIQVDDSMQKKDTGTLLRPGTTDRKFETLKKKLHTDDELNWLNHGQTLREQGVEDIETLVLRRKYFYSDQNVDSRDPIQLNLLYVQSRDGIIKGQYPVSEKDAITFAALQCQIQLGQHDEKKHKPGYIELKDFLPKEYAKTRGIEKKIFAEHKLLENMNEIESKVKYTKNCRDLKTYGVTFFLVKEKMKGRNKLVPRLMGVTRESVMRVDERTKDIIKVWPLTSVKRWAASPKSFTLDFGDYQDGYYSVQTTEGDQIAQLIAGYIDIILKKRQAKDNYGPEMDEDAAMVEDVVSPHRAQLVAMHGGSAGSFHSGSVAMPGVIRNPNANPDSYSMGAMQPPTQITTHSNLSYGGQPLTAAQQAFMGNIEHGFNACRAAHEGFNSKANLPPLGSDAASKQWKLNAIEENRHNIQSNLAAIDAATATVITKTSGDPKETNYTMVGSAVTTISSNLNDMTRGLRLMAALLENDEDGDNLMKAARDLTAAINDLLKAAQPNSGEPRQNILGAAGKVGDASHDILKYIGEGGDDQFQDILMNLAKAVANATAALVLKAKAVASRNNDQPTQNRVIASATQCALSTSQLVACTKVVGPSISNPTCQEQLIDAAREVSQAVDGCVEASQLATNDPDLMRALGDAATGVGKALNDLINHIKLGSGQNGEKYDDQCEAILNATDKLCNSMGNATVMVKQARLLGQATSDLVNMLKLEAEEDDDEETRKKLLAAAKLLADATAKMVEAAKGAANNPHDSQQQQNLKSAAENLRTATNAATQNALRKKLVHRLEASARQAAVAATQTIAAANAAEPYNTNKAGQNQLVAHGKALQQDHVPRLLQGIHAAYEDPDNTSAQQNLINASNDFVLPGTKMVGYSKAVVPTVSDQSTALQLANCTKKLALSIAELKTAAVKASEVCGPSGIDAALESVRGLDRQLSDYCNDAKNGKLQSLPGQSMKSCAQDLGATSKTVGGSMAQLLTAAAQGNEDYTGMAARDTANALGTLVAAARGVSANLPDLDSQLHLLETGRDVMDKSVNLMQEAKVAVHDPENPENRQRLAQVAKAVSHALNNCINCLPGQRDVDETLKNIAESSKRLLSNQFPTTSTNFQTAQSQLNKTAEDLNIAANDLVGACRGTPTELAASSSNYNDRFTDLLNAGLNVAGQSRDREDQNQVVGNLKSISMASSKLLLAAKALSADPGAPNAKNQLAAAARAVTESINNLITHCTQTAPGQKECDNALRQLKTVKEMLENPNEPVNDFSYFDCLESVMDNSKMLGESMSGITQHARASELESFGEAVTATQKSLIGLTEAAAQAAYLVGIADPNSEAGTQGLVDQTQFARANQAIQMACQSLIDPSSNQTQVLSAATIVAKHTSALCNVCRVASNKTTNAVARKHFVQSAKEVANATANLVHTIKALDGNFSEENRANCAHATKPLTDAVESLTTFASNAEFASVPAKISDEAREAQKPIIESGQQMLESSSELIKTARLLANNPKDPPTWQVMAGHSRVVSDSIKKLIANIRDNAPGQKECDDAIQAIDDSIKQLNQASLSAMDQALPPRGDNTLNGFQAMVVDTVNQIGTCIDPLANAAKGDAAQLGRQVAQMGNYFEPLTNATIGAASNSVNHQRQMDILDYSKTLAESALQLMYAAKEGGGNPKDPQLHMHNNATGEFVRHDSNHRLPADNTHEAIEEAAEATKEAIEDLLKSVQEAPEAVMSGMIDTISGATEILDRNVQPDEQDTFAHYQTNIVERCRAIVVASSDMGMAMNNRPEELAPLAKKVTQEYSALANDGAYAVALADSEEVSSHIKRSIQDLGEACKDLMNTSGMVQSDPRDLHAKKQLSDAGRNIKEKVSYVMSSLQQGGRGTQACINAHTQVQGIIGDLDTTLMFVSSGALNTDADTESFADHREKILSTAKALVEDTKQLVAGAASGQEKLAAAAHSASSTINKLADVVKRGATSLGSDDPDTQVVLINAVRDVASALADLINATKDASGKSSSDNAMFHLKASAKAMVTNVTSLLKTVKSVEDEAAKGPRAIEQTIHSIKQELRCLQSVAGEERRASPEELIHITKPITSATAKAVAAGKSCRQEDMVICANMGRKAVFDMIHICRASAANTEDPIQQQSTLNFGQAVAESYASLLNNVLSISQQPNNNDLKKNLIPLSKNVATAVSNMVRSGESMKGSDWVDPNDPNVIAEQELLAAAASIEAAAKKLAQLRPRKKPKQADENLNFEEQILEAAKSIATATTALVKAASAAQKELVLQGKVGSVPALRHDDGQWSQGLISAAQMVARATGNLCEAANQAVQGEASEEKLVTSAKQVASSTAQLLVACKVKADPNSENMKRLQIAGNAVKHASEDLVKAASESTHSDEEVEVVINARLVGGIAQEMMAQEEILRKERELQSARQKLAQIRRMRYKDDSESD
ncbi:talin-2-like isoform X3 [Clavelina lepadiformis]|uniref:talin-2-like isoform X3 n=1 Tax=Clavelina lepadiformis TaxID=159417 RepID=UPI0040436616